MLVVIIIIRFVHSSEWRSNGFFLPTMNLKMIVPATNKEYPSRMALTWTVCRNLHTLAPQYSTGLKLHLIEPLSCCSNQCLAQEMACKYQYLQNACRSSTVTLPSVTIMHPSNPDVKSDRLQHSCQILNRGSGDRREDAAYPLIDPNTRLDRWLNHQSKYIHLTSDQCYPCRWFDFGLVQSDTMLHSIHDHIDT